MGTRPISLGILATAGLLLWGCGGADSGQQEPQPAARSAPVQRSNTPPLHSNNIVNIATASKDHSTLVAALKAADYVTSVAASGPLTVFAPTNAAFDALPPGTVDTLLKPENADDLREVLKYHVTTSSLSASSFKEGQSLGMANGARATMHVEAGSLKINDAKVLASIPAENGMVHVIDQVLLPPEK